MTTARTSDRRGSTVSRWAAAAGITSSAKTSSAPVSWLTSAVVTASSSRKTVDSRRVGTPARLGDVGVDRREDQRAAR